LKIPRHFFHSLSLGLFWGVTPSLYKYLADINMPVLQTIFYSGMIVGLVMLSFSLARKGRNKFDIRVVAYGFGCAALMNTPFAINLVLAAHVPPTQLSIIVTLAPFFNYLFALVIRHETATPRKMLAIVFGFSSTVVLILSREGVISGNISWPLIASLSIPLLYSVYDSFAAYAWPKGADTIQAGAFESLWSGLIVFPLIFWLSPFGAPGDPPLVQHWAVIVLAMMWVVERVVFFTLITTRGAVFTAQSIYISTPTAVVMSAIFFGGGTDLWLWISLAILMVAIYLNNSGEAAKPQSA
jgi:drug/metabolite transporter (DMT)-like permease